jgi:histidyl-tRNA synthetase
VLVAVTDEDARSDSDLVGRALRSRGIPTEVSPSAAKFGKQIKYADRRGIPYVWFIGDDGQHEVKDIRSGEQVSADPSSWSPPTADLHPSIEATPVVNQDPEASVEKEITS